MKMIVKPEERDINRYNTFGQIDLNIQSLVKAAHDISDKSLLNVPQCKRISLKNHKILNWLSYQPHETTGKTRQ